jgi:hypothetical protein
MKNLRRVTISVVCAAALTLACSAKTTGGGGGGGGNGGIAGACADYFQAVMSSCPQDGFVSPSAPASALEHAQSRWEALCAEVLGLPGTSVTPAALEACVSDLTKNGCAALDTATGPCALGGTGTLTSGSSCVSNAQCEQAACTTGTLSPDGGTVLCGTCVTPPTSGQPCAEGQSCGANAECYNSVCTPVTYGGAGASCSGVAEQCGTGFTCNPATGECVAPGGVGTPCEDSEECVAPLVCPQPSPGSGSQACAPPGQVGDTCLDQGDCALGLTCQQSTSKCATIAYVAAGDACNEDTIQCLIGTCNTLGASTGTCPTVIADGLACSVGDAATTCDVFAECTGGVCVFGVPTCP